MIVFRNKKKVKILLEKLSWLCFFNCFLIIFCVETYKDCIYTNNNAQNYLKQRDAERNYPFVSLFETGRDTRNSIKVVPNVYIVATDFLMSSNVLIFLHESQYIQITKKKLSLSKFEYIILARLKSKHLKFLCFKNIIHGTSLKSSPTYNFQLLKLRKRY